MILALQLKHGIVRIMKIGLHILREPIRRVIMPLMTEIPREIYAGGDGGSTSANLH
jgi:hypothetical protein